MINSEDPCCTHANEGCCEQNPAHQLQQWRQCRPHALSIEWVIPKGWLIKLYEEGIRFRGFAQQQQLDHSAPDELGQGLCILDVMPAIEFEPNSITCAVMKS